MVSINYIKNLFLLFFAISTSSAFAGFSEFINDISSSMQDSLSKTAIKPYIIPLEQGRLIEDEKFEQLELGLSREAIYIFLASLHRVLSMIINGIITISII